MDITEVKGIAEDTLAELKKLEDFVDIKIEETKAQQLFVHAASLLVEESTVQNTKIPSKAKLFIVGDLHGQFRSLREILKREPPSRTAKYVFNGDFGGRGPQSLEVYLYLAAIKILHPTDVFLNRGNHESNTIAAEDGFQREITQRLSEQSFRILSDFFKKLPLACTAQYEMTQQRILIVHGGIPPDMTLGQMGLLERQVEPKPGNSPITHILWDDICQEKGIREGQRGEWGQRTGLDVLAKYLSENKIAGMVRSHEEISGVRYDSEICTTVFSAHPHLVYWLEYQGNLLKPIERKLEFETMHPKNYDTKQCPELMVIDVNLFDLHD